MISRSRLLKRTPWLAAAAAAALCTASAAAATSSSAPAANTAYTTHGAWSFVSDPKLHPPKLKTDAKTAKKGLAGGYFLLGNFKNLLDSSPYVGQGGPLLLGANLQPVWFNPVSNAYVNNLAVQTYNGKPALSWWQGVVTNTGATPSGEDVVVDQTYKTVATLTGEQGWTITQHELRIQGHDAWVTANKNITVPAGSVPNCPTCTQVVDVAAQEYDLSKPAGSRLVYNWDAYQHIPLSASQQLASPKLPAYDAYHINSIQLVAGGTELLVSLRNTWAAYLVNVASGHVVWTLGGPSSTYALPSNAVFHWQHDVELHNSKQGTEVTVFDDSCCEITGPGQLAKPTGPSRGLLLKLNSTNNTASLVAQYVHPKVAGADIETAFQGNTDLLSNGNVVIGWGSAPFFSEFSNSGKLLFDGVLPGPDISYRAYVASWVGKPPLRLLHQVAKKAHGKTTVYVSWDGATQVVKWRVLGGNDAKHLSMIATVKDTSFETAIKLAKAYKTYKVQALNSHGHVIGTSKAFGVSSKAPVYGGY